MFLINNIQVYADFSQIVHEIAHSNYSAVSFLNAGVKYMPCRNILVKGSMINLLNNKLYKEAVYSGASYTYYEIPLRGREMLVSILLKF